MNSIISGTIRHGGKAVANIKYQCDLPDGFGAAPGKVRISLPFLKGKDRQTYIRPDSYSVDEGVMRFVDCEPVEVESVCEIADYGKILSELRVSGWDISHVANLVHVGDGVCKFENSRRKSIKWARIIEPDMYSITCASFLLFVWTFISRAFLSDEPVSLLNAVRDGGIVSIVFFFAMSAFHFLYWHFRGKREPN